MPFKEKSQSKPVKFSLLVYTRSIKVASMTGNDNLGVTVLIIHINIVCLFI